MHPTFHPQLTLTHIQDAAQRIRGHAIRTPLLENDTLNNITGGRVLLKAECLQRTGSFKFRGAYNKIAQLSQAQLTLGVVACSSGNHAQGLARTAQLHNCNATIVMPQDAPALKISNSLSHELQLLEQTRSRLMSLVRIEAMHNRHSRDH